MIGIINICVFHPRLRNEIWCHFAKPTDQAFLRSFCHSIEFHAFSLRNRSGDF
jgi:hypothetical protein